ncbi:GntR family transcriptional regulator [[Mycobacterium] burgundiense]|uniref:GntR family transcriptional regulator n=1 Tax=[Mycobacterium] burgundiense TaxID=3064286 RepID=A0ABM9M4U4_9MYCO|nr:GntR family transcriptional regulator [Mycolicibacterium sp. MU0053]CAJ1510180.1 GntR family transcriptional regulator [Mycolicibacterium sp. MU0053]
MNAPAHAQPPARRALRREQLSEEVAAHLRTAITSGQLRPGTFIRLDETAASLGVSITPVREALLTLRGEGMVQLEPHRGHVVLPLSQGDIEDIFWLQATIAKELAASAVEHITDEQIEALVALNDDLARAVDAADVDAVLNAEFAFHRAFNRSAERIKLAWFLLHATRYTPSLVYAADPVWGAEAVAHHTKLIEALRERAVDAVVELAEWQFTDGARRLTDMLKNSGMWD